MQDRLGQETAALSISHSKNYFDEWGSDLGVDTSRLFHSWSLSVILGIKGNGRSVISQRKKPHMSKNRELSPFKWAEAQRGRVTWGQAGGRVAGPKTLACTQALALGCLASSCPIPSGSLAFQETSLAQLARWATNAAHSLKSKAGWVWFDVYQVTGILWK